MKHFMLANFLLIGLHSFSQTKDTIIVAYKSVQNYEMEATTIKKIQKPQKKYYEGSYHFGDSEGESQLEILFSNGKFYARTDYVDWKKNAWVAILERLPIHFLNNKIKIDKAEYELAMSTNEKGLISHYYEKSKGKTQHYIQFNPDGLLEKAKGKYPESSFVKLNSTDLEGFSKWELKIMRNELFARKGYIFRKDGEMDIYFSSQKWYKEIQKNSPLAFTNIEKHNIQLISKLEETTKKKSSNSSFQKEQKFRDTIVINYNAHKMLLTILTQLPKTTMNSWEWTKKDRVKTVNFIKKNNYVIDTTKMYQNIKYIKPNTIGIQVVDGFWTLSIYKFNTHHYFVVTNDIVGDSNDIQTFNYMNNKLLPTKMINWFSDFKYKLLLNKSSKCIQLLEKNELSYDYNFNKSNTVTITSQSLNKKEIEHCFKGNTIIYQLNKNTKTFDSSTIFWKN